MNKYNIEVGDIVKVKGSVGGEVEGVFATGISYLHKSHEHYEPVESNTWEAVNHRIEKDIDVHIKSKMNKGKIVGYTLLKDTPDCTKNTVFKVGDQFDNTTEWYSGKDKDGRLTYFSKESISNPEWFSPIYEEVKPTSIVVKTTPGDVTVTKSHVSFGNGEGLLVDTVSKIIKQIKDFKSKDGGYIVDIETFKVGCKTFHVSDIPKLEAAIKQVS